MCARRSTARRENGQKTLRAVDIPTGEVRRETPQTGPANSWGGVLATAGGIVLFCEDGKTDVAVAAGQVWRASPMTYTFDGKQYVAVVAVSNVMSFGLVP